MRKAHINWAAPLSSDKLRVKITDAAGYGRWFKVRVVCPTCDGVTGVDGGLECPDCEDGLASNMRLEEE